MTYESRCRVHVLQYQGIPAHGSTTKFSKFSVLTNMCSVHDHVCSVHAVWHGLEPLPSELAFFRLKKASLHSGLHVSLLKYICMGAKPKHVGYSL